MSQLLTASRLFRERDLFVHDGSKLRRFRLSAPVQAFLFVCLVALVAWSVFSMIRMVSPNSASVAASAEARAVQIEQRQKILEAMLAGADIDPVAIAAAEAGDFDSRIARAEQVQAAQAQAAAQHFEARYEHASQELKKLGISPDRLNGGVGGPFEAADPTFKKLFTSWKKLDTLQDGAIAVPADKPIKTGAFTSGYGVRSDPFKGKAAMHAGIDLSGPVGTPIYATADGVVSEAGFHNGGYGNLIKIDHGRGIETRYAHLSSIKVKRGQRISRGDLIGKMGSTGRSTGSHLHYEVRIDGRAVNPVPFMKSTDYLVAMQRKANAAPMEQIALGGPEKGKR